MELFVCDRWVGVYNAIYLATAMKPTSMKLSQFSFIFLFITRLIYPSRFNWLKVVGKLTSCSSFHHLHCESHAGYIDCRIALIAFNLSSERLPSLQLTLERRSYNSNSRVLQSIYIVALILQ